jgi:proline iminopeptidase
MEARQKTLFPAAAFLLWLSTALLLSACSKEQPLSIVPKTVDQDASLPAISVNGALLHAEAFGPPDSSLVIVLHGGPGNDYREDLNCKDLAGKGYRVVFYDQRGSGLSQRFPRRFYEDLGVHCIDLMLEDLRAVISYYRKSENQKVFLVGKSWGAILASAYAGKYPDMINGLAVLEPGGLIWSDIKEYVSKSHSFNIWSEALNDKAYIDQFIAGKEDQHELMDYKLAMQADNNEITGEDMTASGSFWRFGAVVSSSLFEIGKKYEPDFSAGLKKFTIPVLFCYSEKNRAYGESWAQKIAGAYASVQLVKIQGVGHTGMLANTEAWQKITLPALLDYLHSR